MAENEAIIREKISDFEMHYAEFDKYPQNIESDFVAAVSSLLQEIQQYRAIGTVERLLQLQHDYWYLNEMCKEYSAIGTIEEFKSLKEKNEPKKAIGKRKYDEAYCPACSEVISDGEFWALDEYVHHCNYCGKAVKGVDWSK